MLTYDLAPDVEAFSTNISDRLDFDALLPVHQAHGTKSIMISNEADIPDTYGADALITTVKGLRIGIKTADCVPILLYDSMASAVAAIHSGWKGTIANITGKTIERMTEECGCSPHKIKAVIGPCIHQEAFEVGDEVHDIFSKEGYTGFCKRLSHYGSTQDIKWHIDLPGICELQLQNAGVDIIEVRDECTYRMHHEFYSARRLGQNFGKQRILSCIKLLG